MILRAVLILLFWALICTAGCEKGEKSVEKKIRSVSVVTIVPKPVSLTVELPGRVSSFRQAEVRPQVGGILQKQLFREGSLVKEGESLYKIDPLLYEADVASAAAALSRAKATETQAALRKDRRRSLLGSHAVSKQAMEDADAQYLQAKADVEVAKAALVHAQIRLQYTDVLAPISGRIGKSNVTKGNLVTANQSEPLAVINQIDPVYVDMTRSTHDLLQLRDRYISGKLRRGSKTTPVHLRFDQSHVYPLEGTLQFSDITVDESTGMVLLRAVFPNPDGILLPGLYVQASVFEGIEEKAVVVPQICVQRTARGEASVFVVEKDGKVGRRTIVTAERIGRDIIVSHGLAHGERVIVSGLRGLRVGEQVTIEKTEQETSR